MKINKHHINSKVAIAADAGLSTVPTFNQKPSTLAASIHRAIHSYPFVLPIFACAMPGLVFATPEGGQVVGGSATISNPNATTTLITQTTANAAIDWQRFDIGSQEYVQFAQPDSSSVALNRVIGGNPSQILGNLSANGQVFLVNPNGVYFGKNATVDVGGIVASVHDISTNDFMARNYVFSKGNGAADAGVVNDGLITARDGGFVVLMGDYVHNNGVISARMGTVALAAGNRITMDVKGGGLVSVVIEEATLSELAGIKNTGEIMATGGRVIMSAKVANDLVDTAINNSGLVTANSITERDGAIFLTAIGGDVVNSGTLDASAEDDSNVAGGNVLVYSDKNVINASGAVISAKGDGKGDGGVVRVIAEEFMNHQSGASIDVTSERGNGGFVELSGHTSLAIRGAVNVGAGGEILIDPDTLTILNTGGIAIPTWGTTSGSSGFVDKGFIESQLNANVNVTLVANNNINAGAGGLGGSTFTLNATGLGDLALINGMVTSTVGGTFGACTFTGVCLPGTGTQGIVPATTGNINLGTVSFNLAGDLKVAGGTLAGTVALGEINAGGDVSITAGSNVILTGNTITAGGDVSIDGDIGSTASLRTADLTINAGNDINIKSDIYLANNNLILAADSDVNGAGDVNITGQANRTVTISTEGALGVTGVNFDIRGASLGTVGNNTGSVKVIADDGNTLTTTDNITVNITGQMKVQGGAATGDASGFNADVSASVSAGNDVTITATGLNVTGGNALALNSSADGSTGNIKASAFLGAGRNIVATLSGSLNVTGGLATANATPTFSSTQAASAIANADAKFNAGNNITVSAGNINIQGGTATADLGTASGVFCSFNACSAIASARADVNAPGAISFTAAAVDGLVTILAGTTTTATNPPLIPVNLPNVISADAKTSVNAGTLSVVSVNGDIIGNNADISAAGMYMQAGNNIDLLTSNVTVGNGTVAGVNGDALTLAFMTSKGITPPTTPNPNAKFRAGGTLTVGTLNMTGDVPYLWLEADTTNIQGLTLPNASDVVVQFSPFTLTKTIGVEATLNTSQDVNYNYLDHFSGLPGTTIIIGSSLQTGAITIGDLSKVDIGAKNMVAVTSSKITSISNVISTGIVAELIIGTSSFITPILTDLEFAEGVIDDADKEKEKKKSLITSEEAIEMCEAG